MASKAVIIRHYKLVALVSYIMGDVEVQINVTLLTYMCSNSIQDVTKTKLFVLWFGVFFGKPSLWDFQMCEFTKVSNIVLPTITFKISFKFSPHHAKLSIFSKPIQSPHC